MIQNHLINYNNRNKNPSFFKNHRIKGICFWNRKSAKIKIRFLCNLWANSLKTKIPSVLLNPQSLSLFWKIRKIRYPSMQRKNGQTSRLRNQREKLRLKRFSTIQSTRPRANSNMKMILMISQGKVVNLAKIKSASRKFVSISRIVWPLVR